VTSRPLPLQRKVPQPAGGALRAAVSAEDMRKLESALRELSECRRLLDAAIKEKGLTAAAPMAPRIAAVASLNG